MGRGNGLKNIKARLTARRERIAYENEIKGIIDERKQEKNAVKIE